MIRNFLIKAGFEISILPLRQWKENVARLNQDSPTPITSATYLSLCRCFDGDGYNKHRTMDLFQATNTQFDTKNSSACTGVIAALRSIKMEGLLELYIDFITKPKS